MIDRLITAIILIAIFYILFFIGKLVHGLLHREYNLTNEIVEKDNPAVALAVTGYYLGLVLGIGGSLTGYDQGIVDDILDLCIFGGLSIILLNISWFLCDKAVLYKFKISDELIRDRNQGTGAVSFGVSIASGLIVYGAVSGEGGNIWTSIAFWAIGQAILILATYVYNFITPYDIHEQIEKDNVAAGISFAGALIAMGVIVGLSAERDFNSWKEDLPTFIFISLIELAMIPLIRFLTHKILLPTVKLTD